MEIIINADTLDLLRTIISSITLLIVVWATTTSQKQFRTSQKNLSSFSGTEIFKTNLEISKLLINKDTFTDKGRVFRELYANQEQLNNNDVKIDDIEINAFILLNLSFYEYIYGAHKFNILKKDEFEGWISHIEFFFTRPMVISLWKDYKYGFQQDFIDWIERKILNKNEEKESEKTVHIF